MAIEKLYLTDTFRVWAEKFNATIDASNTAIANSEEAVKKAEEALQKAKSAAPKKHDSPNDIYGLGSNLNYGHVRGDGETTNVIDGEIVVKDVLINDSISLASSGLLGSAKYISSTDTFNIDTDDFDLLLVNTYYENSLGTFPNFSGFLYIRQYYYSRTSPTVIGNRMQVAFAYNANRMWRRYLLDGKWSSWVKVIDETDLATTSTPGIMQPDNTTITVKGGVISAKAMETIKDITVLNNDFNNLTDSGVYFIKTTQGITKNSPIDLTAYWWVKVTTAVEADGSKHVLQEARLHSTDSGGVAYSLARCKGTTWGPWEYAYTQFAG